MKKYKITKHFITGFLKGLTTTEQTNVKFTTNKQYDNYIITDIKEE